MRLTKTEDTRRRRAAEGRLLVILFDIATKKPSHIHYYYKIPLPKFRDSEL